MISLGVAIMLKLFLHIFTDESVLCVEFDKSVIRYYAIPWKTRTAKSGLKYQCTTKSLPWLLQVQPKLVS
jgi:hypothetical protein